MRIRIKPVLFAILILFCFLCGCNRNINLNESNDSASTEPSEETTTAKDSTIIISETVGLSELKSIQVCIDIPENAQVTSYCIYEDLLFYSIYLESSVLSVYDMATGEYRTIYEPVENFKYIYNLKYNGSCLSWAQNVKPLGGEYLNNYDIYIMDMDESVPQYLFTTGNYNMSLTEKYLCFEELSDYNILTVLRYDLKEKSTVPIIDGISKGVINYGSEYITVCVKDSKSTGIHAYDYEGKLTFSLEVPAQVEKAICNSHLCVWVCNNDEFGSKGSVLGSQYKSVVYDLLNGVTYEMPNSIGQMPAVLRDFIIMPIPYSVGLTSYRVGDTIQKKISVRDGDKYLYYLNNGGIDNVFGKGYSPYQDDKDNGTVTFINIFR